MDDADWKRVEKALSGYIGDVVLKADGHEIKLQRGLIAKNKLGIGTFVDGKIRNEWAGQRNDHPEQRFIYPKVYFVYTAKSRASIKKMSPAQRKRARIQPGEEDKKGVWYTPIFPSVSAIKRHYTKNFPDAVLVSAQGVYE